MSEGTKNKEKTVKVFIPKDRLDPRKHLFVSVNERNFMVAIGKEVEVPECVALVILKRQHNLDVAEAYQESVAADANG